MSLLRGDAEARFGRPARQRAAPGDRRHGPRGRQQSGHGAAAARGGPGGGRKCEFRYVTGWQRA
ncbi:hypothetical protein GCM10023324_07380 [Streptomyces youssoufiensis]